MRVLFAVAFAASVTFGAGQALASVAQHTTIKSQEISHGGGCRKSSPPGQCCHMDNSTGIVHCH